MLKSSSKKHPIPSFWVISPGCLYLIAFTILTLAFTHSVPSSWAADSKIKDRLSSYLDNGGILFTKGDRMIYGFRERDQFCPASTLKTATALMALNRLGESYRFKTEFYMNEHNDLIIKGYGDPFLISEEWEVIVEKIGETGKIPKRLRSIRLDASSFSEDLKIPGSGNSLNPYDAENSALASNFNTAYIQVDAHGKISSAEPQTPLTPLALKSGKGLSKGRHRINLSVRSGAALLYTGELARAFFENGGYSFSEGNKAGSVSPEDRLIYTHFNTRTLRDVISAMMLYSSNYIANQILLTTGMELEGGPATIEKGLASLEKFLTIDLHIKASEFRLFEGSGISRKNRITPRALGKILRSFYPYRNLLTREQKKGALVKTGTLSGVYSLCGYFDGSRPGHFVIMLNQKKNYRDRIFHLLYDEWSMHCAD